MSVSGGAQEVARPSVLTIIRDTLGRVKEALSGDGDKPRTQRAAILAFVIRVLSAGVAYLSQILLARWIGSSEYGIFVFVWVWVLILGGLAPLGINVAMIRFIPEYFETKRMSRLRGILVSGRILAFCVGTLVMLVGIAVLAIWPNAVDGPYRLPAFLAMVCIPVYALTDVQDCMGRARGKMLVALLPPYLMRPLLILVCVFVACELGWAMDATTAAGSAVIATWLAGLVQLVMIEREFRKDVPRGPRLNHISLWLKTSLPILLITGFELFLQNTDVLVISRYMTPADVGLYFAALKTIGLIAFVHYAVGSAFAARFSVYQARGDREELAAFVRDAAIWTFWPSVFGAIVLLAFGVPLLWLFGPEFTAAYPVMFVLAIGFVIRAAMGPAEFVLNMLGEQNRCAMVMFGAVAANIILNFALVPVFGLMGAAFATSTALAVSAVLFYITARNRLGLDVSIFPTLSWPTLKLFAAKTATQPETDAESGDKS